MAARSLNVVVVNLPLVQKLALRSARMIIPFVVLLTPPALANQVLAISLALTAIMTVMAHRAAKLSPPVKRLKNKYIQHPELSKKCLIWKIEQKK